MVIKILGSGCANCQKLEALAKKQSTALGKSEKSAACTQDNLDPAHRVASATGDGGC